MYARAVRTASLLLALAVFATACSPTGAADRTATLSPVPTPSPAPTPAPTVEPPRAVGVTTLLFTGDVIPARCVHAEVQARGGDWRLPFEPLHDLLAGAGITIGTLDSTVSDAVVPTGCVSTFSLGSVEAVTDGLAYAGYDVMSHAANHIKDGGDQAMLDTIANLKGAGVFTAGSGRTIAEARNAAVIEHNGVRFALLAYDDIAPYYHATATAPGAAPLDAATIAQDIEWARASSADVVVVLPHWGVEYTSVPTERQRAFARAAITAGADLIVGNHPHWVQGHEEIDGVFVAYALGNFVFDQDWSLETQQGALLEVTFTGTRMTGARYIPIHVYDRFQPRLAEDAEAAAIIKRIEDASALLAGRGE